MRLPIRRVENYPALSGKISCFRRRSILTFEWRP
jgi:hypothetical protein